jgi:hypothetical protein
MNSFGLVVFYQNFYYLLFKSNFLYHKKIRFPNFHIKFVLKSTISNHQTKIKYEETLDDYEDNHNLSHRFYLVQGLLELLVYFLLSLFFNSTWDIFDW